MSWKKQKLADIQRALNSDPVDVETLRGAAVSEGGLLTDDVRRKVWPKLLSVNVFDLPAKPGECLAAWRTREPGICFTSSLITPLLFLVSLFVLNS